MSQPSNGSEHSMAFQRAEHEATKLPTAVDITGTAASRFPFQGLPMAASPSGPNGHPPRRRLVVAWLTQPSMEWQGSSRRSARHSSRE